MVNYICKRCKKVFTHKNDYTRHINKKKLCVGEDNEISNTLEKKIEVLIKTNENIIKSNDGLKETINNMESKMNNMGEKITKLEEEIKKNVKQDVVVNTVNIDNSINNNVQINVIDHGKEDLTFLTDSDIKKIMMSGLKSVVKYIEFVHCNKNKPEYRNIYISNCKNLNGSIRVYIDNKWELRNKDVIDSLRDRGVDFIVEKYDEFNDEINASANVNANANKNANYDKIDDKVTKQIINMSKRFNNKLDSDADFKWRNTISDEIKTLLYNNRIK
jgi:uncharacterized C2H2 Zn-finger protein